MFRTIFLTILISVGSYISSAQVAPDNDPKLHPQHVLHVKATSLSGKPIVYYLNHKQVDPLSKALYRGNFAIYDNEAFFSILDSVMTRNDDTRPFYFFLFNKVLDISDGAIAEYMTDLKVRFLKKYSCLFFEYYVSKQYAVSFKNWAQGLEIAIPEKEQNKLLRSIEDDINRNCSQHTKAWQTFKKYIIDSFKS